jgi:hypothetical protein
MVLMQEEIGVIFIFPISVPSLDPYFWRLATQI